MSTAPSPDAAADAPRHSFYEATARQRVRGLFDAGSVVEWLPPTARVVSPHLEQLGLPRALDDGIVIGRAALQGRAVLFAAEEPGFMGGSVGEVHGAKLTGLLERAARDRPAAAVLLLDTGGVRLHEANAGLIAISEIQRAVFAARAAGVPVVVVSAGANGCYGGLGIVARCCDHVVMTEEGRLSVSGPEVIESQKGVEEFDARDRALVWRTMGGKHRYLLGEADGYALDDMEDLRRAVAAWFDRPVPLTLEAMEAEHAALGRRLERFGRADDATEIWSALGVQNPKTLPLLGKDDFLALAERVKERGDA